MIGDNTRPLNPRLSKISGPMISKAVGHNILFRSKSNKAQSRQIHFVSGPKPMDMTNPVHNLLPVSSGLSSSLAKGQLWKDGLVKNMIYDIQ
jgi:hypothetical protein